MENVDKIYKVELNFVDEFNLSRNGMIKEIEVEFNIVKLCLQEMSQLDTPYLPMLDRIMVMPLRKLLCEDSSVLLNVCLDFKMPQLAGYPIVISDSQTMIRPPYKTGEMNQWILVKDWLEQNISWFSRDTNTIAEILPKYSYDDIMKKLSGRKHKSLKPIFQSMFCIKKVQYNV